MEKKMEIMMQEYEEKLRRKDNQINLIGSEKEVEKKASDLFRNLYHGAVGRENQAEGT